MIKFGYMVICVALAFFLAIILEGFGGTLLLGTILGVLLAISHQLTNIYKCLKSEIEEDKQINILAILNDRYES